ncbi:FUSC family protein [Cereibacter sphaeroides]|uniref:FUSC family protein n=1 Tax=Cereibacter sphaeroides TaxID=1063 RepID=UPI00313D71BA
MPKERIVFQFAAYRIMSSRRHALRVAVQTAVATLAVHLLMRPLAPDLESWAVIAALFTIGTSVDATLGAGISRIAGTVLGAGLGLAVTGLLGGSSLPALLLAAVLSNSLAAIWPGLTYAAVMAAIVALDPSPDGRSALALSGAVVLGTIFGTAASFLVWPEFGRNRAVLSLREAMDDCREFLGLIHKGVTTDDRRNRYFLHQRFRGHLFALYDRIAETHFTPQVRSGAGLREAADAVEALWYALVILDRGVISGRARLSDSTVERVRPVLAAVQTEACRVLESASVAAGPGRATPTDPTELKRVLAEARELTLAAAAEGRDIAPAQEQALQALSFALDEMERSLMALMRVIEPECEAPDKVRAA